MDFDCILPSLLNHSGWSQIHYCILGLGKGLPERTLFVLFTGVVLTRVSRGISLAENRIVRGEPNKNYLTIAVGIRTVHAEELAKLFATMTRCSLAATSPIRNVATPRPTINTAK